jgi:hypothetical protein
MARFGEFDVSQANIEWPSKRNEITIAEPQIAAAVFVGNSIDKKCR